MMNFLSKIKRFIKIEWAVFCYIESTEGQADLFTYGIHYVENKIKSIRNNENI
jgi:hypothetical protein